MVWIPCQDTEGIGILAHSFRAKCLTLLAWGVPLRDLHDVLIWICHPITFELLALGGSHTCRYGRIWYLNPTTEELPMAREDDGTGRFRVC